MIINPALRYHPRPIYHVRIVTERKDARSRDLGGEEDLGPRLGCVVGGPCFLAIAGQTMHENYAMQKPSG